MENDEKNMLSFDALQSVTGGTLSPEEIEEKKKEFDEAFSYYRMVSDKFKAFAETCGEKALFSEWGEMKYPSTARAYLRMKYYMTTGEVFPWN